MIWLLAFVKLLAADSIILSNDCSTVAQAASCRIELETLKGTPGADCPLFSTVDRSCSVYDSAPEASTTSPNPGQETDHSVSENGQVTIVTFNASNANGSTSLHGETIWSRPPPGSVQISTVAKSSLPDVNNLPKVVCLCTPSGIDLEAQARTNQNLAEALLSGDGSQARLKRDQNEPDPEDDEQMGKHLTRIAEEASQNIQAELGQIEEKPRTKRNDPSSDSPFTANDLYEDGEIPVQEFHEFKPNPSSNFALTTNISNLVDALPSTPKMAENSTRTQWRSTSAGQLFTGTVTTTEMAENPTRTTFGGQSLTDAVTTKKMAENPTKTTLGGQPFTGTLTTTTTTELPVSPKNENHHHDVNDFNHQTITESTTVATKRVQKREVKEAEEATTEPGLINWGRRGPRG